MGTLSPGRTDATQEMTDVDTFAWLEPQADGFRNYHEQGYKRPPAEALVDMSTRWRESKSEEGIYEGLDRDTGEVKWTATPVDLIFGSNSELRAVSEYYSSSDVNEKFVQDFVSAWSKVMTADRFDLK